MSNDPTIQELLDKEKIREVIGIRYARGLDWYDLDMLKSCFHADAVLDYGYFKGNAHEWCEKRVVAGNPAELHRFHYCFPAHIEISGDIAHAESNSYAGYRTRDDAGEKYLYFGTRYVDTIERRGGNWRISQRIVLVDFTQTLASPGEPAGLQKGIPMLSRLSPAHPHFKRLCAPN